ncbi:aldose 1-epimerase family protein [Pantoea sp. BAV 3049]|uniref:aldose 1-epimerase family protein n=1 Tax=Pantoea sp. BAV 3049 TaxID=2654188 RepID=UPI00131B0327|nr:aldose 1-epimerase family protein [Pantoea sp. BAV 3049]
MKTRLPLHRSLFGDTPRTLLENGDFSVKLFRYPAGIEAVRLENSRGHVIVLPFYGQMIWDAEFDGQTLTMGNGFTQPLPGQDIIDTYGCFAFHSGLLANGCPAADDTHALHGEMACARMDSAWVELENDRVALRGETNYIKGFGHHYRASPGVTLLAGRPRLRIEMVVSNLSGSAMPLQYMCHMNYAYVENGTFSQSIPDSAFQLRTSIPGHVHPTPNWLDYTRQLQASPQAFDGLNRPEMYDPEIVFFADNLAQYGSKAEFQLHSPEGYGFSTIFDTAQFNYATRWILHNADQQVAAFVLPATCRPEGFNAAKQAGTLISLESGEQRQFCVETGLIE